MRAHEGLTAAIGKTFPAATINPGGTNAPVLHHQSISHPIVAAIVVGSLFQTGAKVAV